LEDGIVGDPMEKTALETLKWKLSKGDVISPDSEAATAGTGSPHKAQIHIKRRFQFSSALKRMSTVSSVTLPGNSKKRTLVAVKGAPETLKPMYTSTPSDYEATYKWFAQRGSRVLALGYRWADNVQENQDIS
jgi:cation-transporting ATPase 13A1